MSFKKWQLKKLVEIGDVITGKTPSTKKENNFGNKVYFITPRDMSEQKKVTCTERKLSKLGVDSVKKQFIKGPAICVSCIGSDMGKVVICDEDFVTNQQINTLTNIKDIYNIDFVYYALKLMKEYLHSIAGGSTMPIVNKSTFENIEIFVPSLQEQKAISKILSDLDEKIETNNKINKKLEEMAQAIFKQWFVDFEFPNEDGKPYKSSGGEMVESELGMIPKGWEIKELRQIIKFIKGKKPEKISYSKFDGSKRYLTIDAFNGNSTQFAIDNKVVLANKKDILMVMDGASSGTLYYGIDGVVGSTLAKITLSNQEINEDVLYYLLKLNEADIKTHLTGSAIPHTDKEFVNRLIIGIPRELVLLNNITKILSDFRDEIIVIKEENMKLINLRNILLPKLMSGELRVQLS